MNIADQLRVSLAAEAMAGNLKHSDPEKFKEVQEDLRDYYLRELEFAQAQQASEDQHGR